MKTERRVRLFRNRPNQAARFTCDLELPGEDAILRREGDRLIIEPVKPSSLVQLLKTLSPIEETLPHIEDPAPDDVNL